MESSYLSLPQGKIYKHLYNCYLWLSAICNPVWWILDRRTKTILDLGCGQGYPMQILKMINKNIQATGVDLFETYLKEARRLNIYEKVKVCDVNKLPFKEKSFDTVICLQVIEHLSKKNGIRLIKKMENIAKFQVIITTPLGFFDHPDMDSNKLQRHLSGWSDEDFQKMGYSIRHQGLNYFYGNDGLVHRSAPKILRAAIFILDNLLMPVYYFFPRISDYWIIAYKKLK